MRLSLKTSYSLLQEETDRWLVRSLSVGPAGVPYLFLIDAEPVAHCEADALVLEDTPDGALRKRLSISTWHSTLDRSASKERFEEGAELDLEVGKRYVLSLIGSLWVFARIESIVMPPLSEEAGAPNADAWATVVVEQRSEQVTLEIV